MLFLNYEKKIQKFIIKIHIQKYCLFKPTSFYHLNIYNTHTYFNSHKFHEYFKLS